MFLFPKGKAPDSIVAGVICAWHNLFDSDQIKSFIDEIEKEIKNPDSVVRFEKAVTIQDQANSSYSGKRTNYNLNLTAYAEHNEVLRKMNNEFFANTTSATEWYRAKFNITEPIQFRESLNLLRYQYGEHYDAHYDGPTGSGRCVSPILYLNDDYEGGELEFANFGIKIKPVANTLYLFPASYPYSHIAHPVKTGTKYAIVTWLHDR